MNLLDKYKIIDVLNGKTIKEIKLWADGIEIIPTEGKPLVIDVILTQKMEFAPWFRTGETP